MTEEECRRLNGSVDRIMRKAAYQREDLLIEVGQHVKASLRTQALPLLRIRMAKILLVEDNEMNRDMLSRRLAWRGHPVVLATDGRHGIELASTEAPDLILMDMSLPGMDGWEATRHLKATEATRHIPIIALTAHAMTSDRQRAIEAGCDEYETKPVELQRLLLKIDGLLGTEQAR